MPVRDNITMAYFPAYAYRRGPAFSRVTECDHWKSVRWQIICTCFPASFSLWI